jgi:hypothetical protein
MKIAGWALMYYLQVKKRKLIVHDLLDFIMLENEIRAKLGVDYLEE